jgi:putative PIN family toxin of toxin-antitoxin system
LDDHGCQRDGYFPPVLLLDTNILISALIRPKSVARQIYEGARSGRIALVTCDAQLDEFRRVTRYPKVQRYIRPAEAGRMLNELRDLAVLVEVKEEVDVDNFLVAMAQASQADYLVTGDKADVPALVSHGKTQIVTARKLVELLKL